MKLVLKYPVYPHVKTQGFGESYACIDPVTKKVVGKPLGGTCPSATVDLYEYSGMKGHNGIDIYAPSGTPVYFAGPEGIVNEVCTEEARGLGVGVITQNKYEINEGEFQLKFRDWHLKGINVKLGQAVKQGDLIGWVDSTGYSSGNHDHFEMKPVKDGVNAFQDNGFYGAVNPEPYFDGTYAIQPFNTDLSFGARDNRDVERLQQFLRERGFFTHPVNTGNYLELTRQAVLKFQLEHVGLNWYERTVLRGMYVGPKTRATINRLLGFV